MGKDKFIDSADIVRGIAEVSIETARRAGAGLLHMATQQFQHETPSLHHFEHPITDRPATYTFPTDSEGAYLPDDNAA